MVDGTVVYKVIKTSHDLDQSIRSLDFERVQSWSVNSLSQAGRNDGKKDEMVERRMKWWNEMKEKKRKKDEIVDLMRQDLKILKM